MVLISWNRFKKLAHPWPRWYNGPVNALSFVVLQILLLLRLSANAVSWLGVFSVFLGCILVYFGHDRPILVILGFFAFVMRYIFDNCDGIIARIKKVFSAKGILIDYFGHAFEMPFFYLALTVLAYDSVANIIVFYLGLLCLVLVCSKRIIEGQVHTGFLYDFFITADMEQHRGLLDRLKKGALLSKQSKNASGAVRTYDEVFWIQLIWDYLTVVLIFFAVYVLQLTLGLNVLIPLLLALYCLAYLVFLFVYVIFIYSNFEKKCLGYVEKIKKIVK